MTKPRKWITVVVMCIVAVAAVYAYPYRLYYLRDDNSGVMVWNADQAYLFMKVARRGYHMSYAEYPWGILSEWLGGVPLPNDQRVFLIVIHVTPSGVERHLALTQSETAGVPDSFTPMGQSVYTFCNGVLCKWAGDRFENATQQEQQEIGGIEHLIPDSTPTVNGWTKRGVYGDFSVELGKQTTIKLKKTKSSLDTPIVELDQPGQSSQELWNVDGQPRRISWWKYKQSFGGDDLR
jgi:hypothetical protein